MLSLLKRYRELIVVSALLLYPFARFLSAGQQARDPSFLDRAVLWVSAPVQWILSGAIDGLANGWSGYVALRGVELERQTLLDENTRLKSQLNVLEEAKAENERLKGLLAYSEQTVHTEISARVVGVNPVSTFLSIRIDRGESDGVQRGMPVVTPGGIVGQVLRTTGGYADVMLITDESSRVGVRVQRSRVRATASGLRGSRLLALEYALRTEDVQEGDLLITSGTDGVFPSGLVVGRVQSLEKKNFGMFQTAEVVPAVELAKLEEVLVVPVLPTAPQTARSTLLEEATP